MTTNITVNSFDMRARLRQLAMPFLFFLLGVLYASWAARIPAIRDRLELDAATLSMVLLCSGIGAVCSFPLAAWLNAHYGARHTASYSGAALLLVLPCLGGATNLPLLMLGCFCYGSAASCFDVAINALGAEHEKQLGRSIMSMLHAWFCVGTFSGALLGSAMASLEIAPWQHFLLLSLLFVLPLRWSYRRLPNDRPHHDPQRKVFALPHGHLVALGLIVFCGAIVEGSISNWSGIYMKDHLHAGDGVAPLSYAGFAGMMLVSRMLGDRLKERWGARSIVGYGSVLAAVGISLVVLAPSIAVAAIGFMIVGAGVAMVFPFVFSAAGRCRDAGLQRQSDWSASGGDPGPGFWCAGGTVIHWRLMHRGRVGG